MIECWDADLFYKTVEFVMKQHDGQKIMLSKMPYIGHLFEVFGECVNGCFSEKILIDYNFLMQVSLLHDVLEDTNCTYKELKNHFGHEIANGVLALTKNQTLPYELRLKDSLNRILKQPKEVALVKLADRIVNLQEKPLEWNKEKLKHYQKDAVLILETLGNFSKFLSSRLNDKIQTYL